MGYYVTAWSAHWTIPAENAHEAFVAACRLNDHEFDHLKRGAHYEGGKIIARWYSWMTSDYHLTTKDLGEILDMLGFQFKVDSDGYHITGYDDRNGQQDLFLAEWAPLSKEGSYIAWRGEDGKVWRHLVVNGVLKFQYAEQTYQEMFRAV